MSEQLCVTLCDYVTHMMNSFRHLLVNQSMVDVTLACDGLSLKAHKIVLSACSPLFHGLFIDNPCQHPIVILKDVKYNDMKTLLDIIYTGKVNVSENQLSTLRKTAELLKVRGVTEAAVERVPSDELPQQSVSKPDGPPSKRRKRRSRKSSLNEQSAGKASQSGNLDSDIEEVYTKMPMEVDATRTFPPEDKNFPLEEENVTTIQLHKETFQEDISMQENQSSVQSIMKQQKQSQSNIISSTRAISFSSNSLEIASQQPDSSAGNVLEKDEWSTLKEALETLKMKGLLTARDGNDQSSDAQSADKKSLESTSDVEIISEDSDIEEIIPDKEPRQRQTVQLDDDELIITDDIPSCSDASHPQSTTKTSKQSINLLATPAFNSQHIVHSSETPKRKGINVNENNQSVDDLSNGSVPWDEPLAKRRKHKRQKISKSNRSTRNCNSVVLQLDSDIEEMSSEPSNTDSEVSTPKENFGLESRKLPEKTFTVDDVPSHSNTSDDSSLILKSSFPEVNGELPENPSVQLLIQDQLLAVIETVQDLLSEIDGQNDGVCEFKKSDSDAKV